MRNNLVYKILRQDEWAKLRRKGVFQGSTDDDRDGFIHLSTKDQLQGTLDKHYTAGDVVILAEVSAGTIADNLKYEVSRGGAEFPHLYGVLRLGDVTRHWALSPDQHGRYAVQDYLTD